MRVNNISLSQDQRPIELAGIFRRWLPKPEDIWRRDFEAAAKADMIDPEIISQRYWDDARQVFRITEKYPPTDLSRIQLTLLIFYVKPLKNKFSDIDNPTKEEINLVRKDIEYLSKFVRTSEAIQILNR